MDLKNTFGDVVFSASVGSIRDLILAAVKAGADLSRANLSRADLSGANLSWANLSRANLWGADLSGAKKYAPTMVLLAYWGAVSAELTADLMEFDAASHPDRTAFDKWAAGGFCPYDGVLVGIGRVAHFKEQRHLWGKGKLCGAYDLMIRLFKEKEIKF